MQHHADLRQGGGRHGGSILGGIVGGVGRQNGARLRGGQRALEVQREKRLGAGVDRSLEHRAVVCRKNPARQPGRGQQPHERRRPVDPAKWHLRREQHMAFAHRAQQPPAWLGLDGAHRRAVLGEDPVGVCSQDLLETHPHHAEAAAVGAVQGVVRADGGDDLGMDRAAALARQAVFAFGVIDAHRFLCGHALAQRGQIVQRGLRVGGQRLAARGDPQRLPHLAEGRGVVRQAVEPYRADGQSELAHGRRAGLRTHRRLGHQRQRGMHAQHLLQVGRLALAEPAAEHGKIEDAFRQDLRRLLAPGKVQPRHAFGRQRQQQVIVDRAAAIHRVAGCAGAGRRCLRQRERAVQQERGAEQRSA